MYVWLNLKTITIYLIKLAKDIATDNQAFTGRKSLIVSTSLLLY